MEKLSQIVFIVVITLLFRKIIVGLFFRPYRNKFMVWYMLNFNKHYLEARKMFDELILMQEEYQDDVDVFLRILEKDSRFRSMTDTEQKPCFENSQQAVFDVDELLEKGFTNNRTIEGFACFYGKGNRWHTLWLVFDFKQSLHLSKIFFFYHEKWENDYFHHELDKKEFPPDDDGGRRKKLRRPNPPPVLKKQLVSEV